MGTEYYVARHDTKQLFGLGKYLSYELNENYDWLYDKSVLLERIVLNLAWTDMPVGYCLYIRDRIWDFCQGVGSEKDVEVISEYKLEDLPYRDSENRNLHYTERWKLLYDEIGDRYAKEEDWKNFLKNRYELF